jgi:hypothetical protein
MSLRAALAVAALVLQGCSIPNPTRMEFLDDLPEDKFSEIDALPEVPAGPKVAVLGEVEGVSCKRSYRGAAAATWEDAVRRTKYRAIQKGGNAISNLSCGLPKGSSFTTLCLESIRCTASAVRNEK